MHVCREDFQTPKEWQMVGDQVEGSQNAFQETTTSITEEKKNQKPSDWNYNNKLNQSDGTM